MPGGKFTCELCGFTVPYDSLGKKPPFCKSIILKEDAYVMKDPFSDKAGTHQAIILGSRCAMCSRIVCVGKDCSLYYSKRFCLSCVLANINSFPEEIQQEMKNKKS